MANAFDKFDGTNAFDKFDAKKPAPESTIDNILGGAKNLAYGIAKGVADPIYGTAQLGMHGLNALSGNRLSGITNDLDAKVSDIENQYQADTPGSIPAGAGRFLGNMAYPIRGGGLVKSAATGAAIGLTQPVVNQADSYAAAKALQTGVGAVLGGTLPIAGAALGGLYNTIKPAVNPGATVGDMFARGFKKIPPAESAAASPAGISAQGVANGVKVAPEQPDNLSNLLGNRNAADVLKRIANAPKLVDGSLPTTAQVAGVPQLVMAEKTLSNNPAYKVALMERQNANDAARLAALDKVAGTPEQLTAATKARSDAVAPMYAEANALTHNIDPQLGELMSRPSVQQAIARGQRLASEKGGSAMPTPGTSAQPAQQVPTGLLDASGTPMTRELPAVAATPGTVSGQTLQYMKMGLSDLQQEGKRNGMGSHEQGALADTQSSLHDWLMSNAPAYKAADGTYAQMSVPVNTMTAGQAVRQALQNKALNSEGQDVPTLTRFNSAMTGALKDQKYGIDPAAEQVLGSIRSDLQRETISNSVRSAGSDTVFNAQAPNWLAGKLYGSDMSGKTTATGYGLGGMLGALAGSVFGPIASNAGLAAGATASNRLASFVGNRVNDQFQRAMLEPEYFTKLLQESLARQQGSGGLLNPAVNQGAAVFGAGLLASP